MTDRSGETAAPRWTGEELNALSRLLFDAPAHRPPGGTARDPDSARGADVGTGRGHDPPPPCPTCGSPLLVRPVPHPPGVSYVRRRFVLTCAGCHRTAVLDQGESR